MTTKLKNVIKDMVSNFLYYDRKEDEELPVDEIEAMISRGEVTIDEIVEEFKTDLIKWYKS